MKYGANARQTFIVKLRSLLFDKLIRISGVMASMCGSNPLGQGSNPWGSAKTNPCLIKGINRQGSSLGHFPTML